MEKCKYTSSCPVYSGELKAENLTTGMFKRNYCESDTGNWDQCKRFQVVELGGEPAETMPHDPREAEEIVSGNA